MHFLNSLHGEKDFRRENFGGYQWFHRPKVIVALNAPEILAEQIAKKLV